jgi:hypothetical protein
MIFSVLKQATIRHQKGVVNFTRSGWSISSGSGWSVCSGSAGQFPPDRGGQFHRILHIALSKDKWQWMADKNVDKLAPLFHDKSKFVHMSGTWKKDEELEIIKTGSIWYKKADVKDVAIELIDDTAIVWNRMHLVQCNRTRQQFLLFYQ